MSRGALPLATAIVATVLAGAAALGSLAIPAPASVDLAARSVALGITGFG